MQNKWIVFLLVLIPFIVFAQTDASVSDITNISGMAELSADNTAHIQDTADGAEGHAEHYPLLEILGVGFALALILGFIANKLGLSPIVGYLLAGFIVGPATPGYVADPALINQLSEVGVILMMFGVGLHFDMKDLMAVKGVALPGALIQSTVATLVGYYVAIHFGFTSMEAVILGIGLAVASTVVLLRVLTDSGSVDTVHGHVAVGWLVVEDILTVLVIVIMPTLGLIFAVGSGVSVAGIAGALGWALVKLVVLWVIVLMIGGKLLPYVLTQVARTRSQELFTLTILMAAFAISVGSAEIFGVSMALGAFLGGMAVGKSSLSHQAGSIVLPLKDAFSAIFFISVGILFNPHFLVTHTWLIIACLAIILIIKPLTAFISVSILGYSAKTGIIVGLALAQIGEFSFILAQQAMSQGLIRPDGVYDVLVVCALITITFNPGLFKQKGKILKLLQKSQFIWKIVNYRVDKKMLKASENNPIIEGADQKTTAVVVGYGPTGQNVVQALIKNNIEPIVIDLNIDTINELNVSGIHGIYGDSSKKDILHAAKIEHADYLVVTIPGIDYAAATIMMASTMNANMRILARVRFLKDVPLLEHVGADVIISEEGEVANRLTEMLISDIETHWIEKEKDHIIVTDH